LALQAGVNNARKFAPQTDLERDTLGEVSNIAMARARRELLPKKANRKAFSSPPKALGKVSLTAPKRER
jgi:hypothetical protein